MKWLHKIRTWWVARRWSSHWFRYKANIIHDSIISGVALHWVLITGDLIAWACWDSGLGCSYSTWNYMIAFIISLTVEFMRKGPQFILRFLLILGLLIRKFLVAHFFAIAIVPILSNLEEIFEFLMLFLHRAWKKSEICWAQLTACMVVVVHLYVFKILWLCVIIRLFSNLVKWA
jgi:hypothetical protein